jgi:hypothetical protein
MLSLGIKSIYGAVIGEADIATKEAVIIVIEAEFNMTDALITIKDALTLLALASNIPKFCVPPLPEI